MAPPKNEPTQKDLERKVREEGKIGKLRLYDSMRREYPPDIIAEVFKRIKLQVYKAYHFEQGHDDYTLYYGYCDLFEPIIGFDKVPTYNIKIDFEHGGMIVELFKLEE